MGGGGVRIRQLKKNTAAVAVAWGKEQQGTAGSWPYHAKIYIERTQQSVNDVTMEMCRLRILIFVVGTCSPNFENEFYVFSLIPKMKQQKKGCVGSAYDRDLTATGPHGHSSQLMM